MKTLEQLKNQYADARGFNNWQHCFTACTKETVDYLLGVIAEEYASQFKQPPPQISQDTAREMLKFIKHAVVSYSYEYPVRRSELIQKAEQELNTK